MARWISPLWVQGLCLLVDPLVLHLPLPIDAPPTAAVPLIPVMLVARLCAASLPRCGISSPGQKFKRESKVRWSSVILLPCPRCLHSLSISILGLQTLSLSILGLQTLSISILGLQTLLAAPLLRELAAYLVSGRPSAAASICGELFNSSQYC